MGVTISIPTGMRGLADGRDMVEVRARSVGQALEALAAMHPGLGQKLLNDDGQFRSWVNLFLNDQDVRFLDGPLTPTNDGDELAIVSAIAGG